MKAKKCKSCGANLKGNKCEFCLTEYVFDTPKEKEPSPKVNMPETPKPVETNPRKTLGCCIAIAVIAAVVAGIIFLPSMISDRNHERSQINSVNVILPETPMSFTGRAMRQEEMVVTTESTVTNIEYTLSYNWYFEQVMLHLYITGYKTYDISGDNLNNVSLRIVSLDADGRSIPIVTRELGRPRRNVDELAVLAGRGYAIGEEFTVQSNPIFLEYGETFRFHVTVAE